MTLIVLGEMVDMAESLIKQCCDVGVEEPVDHVTPTSSSHHEAEISQNAQLVRDGRLLHLHFGAEIAHRARAGSQSSEDPHTAGGGEGAHDAGDLLGRPLRQRDVDRRMVRITHTGMFTCACMHVNPYFIHRFLRLRIK
jgi:hypothetical protein